MVKEKTEKRYFDACQKCGRELTQEKFVELDGVRPVGMIVEKPGAGVFCFKHEDEGCGETLAIPIKRFISYVKVDIPEDILHGTDACKQHCVNIDDLERCDQPCGNAPYRELMLDLFARWKEKSSE